MRKTNVFGKKQSRVRPFYALLLVFVILIPVYLLVNYIFEQRLSDLEAESIQIQREIDLLVLQYQSSEPSDITPGMIYTGFESYHFDFYLKDEIILLFNMADIVVESSNQINVSTSTTNPLTGSISGDIAIKEINATITVADLDQMIGLLNLLQNQEQLYYIDDLQSSLLEDGDYRIQMTFYVFCLDN